MGNHEFIFRGEEMYYDYEWSDPDTFSFFFGEGWFVDDNGDDYFINVEYLVDADKFIFEAMFECDCCFVTEEHLSEHEKEEIKKFIKELVAD